jgi:hypothetical protein
MSERHIITIGTDGAPQIAVEGVKGSSCKQATEAIERALGRTIKDTETAEFFEVANVTAKH